MTTRDVRSIESRIYNFFLDPDKSQVTAQILALAPVVPDLGLEFEAPVMDLVKTSDKVIRHAEELRDAIWVPEGEIVDE